MWLKERLYDLRVFAGSSVVADTVIRRGRPQRLVEYFNSVRTRFSDYEELQLVDAKSGLVASSARSPSAIKLPDGWQKPLDTSRGLIGEPYWDEKAKKVVVALGVHVQRGDGKILGALVARVNFTGLTKELRTFGTGHVLLATENGVLIADSSTVTAGEGMLSLAPGVADRLLGAEGQLALVREPPDSFKCFAAILS